MVVSIIRKSLLFISLLLFPFTFISFSPYHAVEGSAYGIVAASLAIWFAVLATSPVAARASCSYLCPFGGLQMCMDAVVAKPLVRSKRLLTLKYLLFWIWIGLIALFAVSAGGYHVLDFFYKNPTRSSFGSLTYLILLIYLLVVAVPAFFLGRRAFCHYFCFFSPLSISGWKLANRLSSPVFHVKVARKEACIRCRRCDKDCSMSLPVSRYVDEGKIEDPECIACGNCIAACPVQLLEYGFGPNVIHGGGK